MNLYRVDWYPEVAESWQWWEAPGPIRSSGQQGTIFVWGN